MGFNQVSFRMPLGWEGQGLAMLGKYAIDEVGLRGPPASVVIRGKPANMRATSKTQRYGSWSNAKLADIIGDVARRNRRGCFNCSPANPSGCFHVCSVSLAVITIQGNP